MLVTHESWEESHPVKAALMLPHQVWQCVGWSNKISNFWVHVQREPSLPRVVDGWMVADPEAMLGIAATYTSKAMSVHVLDVGPSGGLLPHKVTALWREPGEQGVKGDFWYEMAEGGMRRCLRDLQQTNARPELVRELVFGE
ncbi:hypothetical protein [Paraburkholderia dilworthii]|uniref:hypothetical protein n=1 Tax=Paraburkholderia dilworthii TaxID=948106 RepID=UPI001269870D|nr:hypothetical protein [Paraburkholderia dilworthii]